MVDVTCSFSSVWPCACERTTSANALYQNKSFHECQHELSICWETDALILQATPAWKLHGRRLDTVWLLAMCDKEYLDNRCGQIRAVTIKVAQLYSPELLQRRQKVKLHHQMA